MPNPHIAERLAGVLMYLMGGHAMNATLSSASKGREREDFVNGFLSQVLPIPYRFGTGDATDASGGRSGQLDIVVEHPFFPSLPSPNGSQRLYLAESIAAVIEVKSDVAGQWDEVRQTARQLHNLHRGIENYTRRMHGGSVNIHEGRTLMTGMVIKGNGTGAGVSLGPEGFRIAGQDVSPGRIPLFAVGYKGWKTVEAVQRHVDENVVDGILIIDGGGLFISGERFRSMTARGPSALWGFICCLHEASAMLAEIPNDPLKYMQ